MTPCRSLLGVPCWQVPVNHTVHSRGRLSFCRTLGVPTTCRLTVLQVTGIAILFLSGCASQIKIPETVLVPTPVACVEKIPEKPKASTDAELKGMTDYELVLTLASERAALVAYSLEASALLDGCK